MYASPDRSLHIDTVANAMLLADIRPSIDVFDDPQSDWALNIDYTFVNVVVTNGRLVKTKGSDPSFSPFTFLVALIL